MTECFPSLAFTSIVCEENFMSMDKPAISVSLGSAISNVKFFYFYILLKTKVENKGAAFVTGMD